MPNCPMPGRETKAAALSGQAEFKAKQLAEKKAEAVRLHRVLREPHSVITNRLKITRPTLVAWLREAELDGYSARPNPEGDVIGTSANFSEMRLSACPGLFSLVGGGVRGE